MAERPTPPRGRAALIQRLKEVTSKPGPGTSAEQPSEPARPKGRAALLSKLREHTLRVSSASQVECTNGSRITEITETMESVSVKEREPSPEREICSFQGNWGKPVYMTANYVQLQVDENKRMHEYDLRFNPLIDSKDIRIKLLNSKIRELGGLKAYDGASVVYLPVKLPDARLIFNCTHPISGENVTMTVTYKKIRKLSECTHFFNILFKRVMIELKCQRVGRNFYDMNLGNLIPQHKLEIFPGYAVVVDEYEGGLLVCLDSQHKVLRTDTALELMNDIRISKGSNFQVNVQQNLIGKVVLTKYNNKTYVVHDVLWNSSPKNTFKTSSGKEIDFMQYYKQQYDITIEDQNQPMLLHIEKVRKATEEGLEERMILLVPELCHLTGLTDEMRNNYIVMKDVAQFTKLTPQQRMDGLRRYMDRVNRSPEAKKILSDWGLSLKDVSIDLNARVLNSEKIKFGGDREFQQQDGKADWTGALTRNQVYSNVPLVNWTIVHVQKDTNIAREFVEIVIPLGRNIGMNINKPTFHMLTDDRTGTYVRKCQEIVKNPKLQMIVFIFTALRNDLYGAVKKVCCLEKPLSIQCVLSRTLCNPKRLRAITLKIILQILCKIGGSPWALHMPCRNWMVIGIDVYHSDKGSTKQSVLGFVSSTDETFTQWFSVAVPGSKEISAHLKMCFVRALEKYKNSVGSWPTNIIVFRDGVGEGQFGYCKNIEIPQFLETINDFKLQSKLSFVVVQKRINTRLYLKDPRNKSVSNPPPGAIVDNVITERYLYDFFLVPQNVTQGTVTPTHYFVLQNDGQIAPNHMQGLSFKMCHLYYNWSGTIRVPAPCQYAHKLAFLIGQHIGKPALEELNDKLYYL